MIDRIKELDVKKRSSSLVRLEEGQRFTELEDAFFGKVNAIRTFLTEIEQIIDHIEYLHKQALVAVKVEACQDLARRIALDTDRTNAQIIRVRGLIMDLGKERGKNDRMAKSQNAILGQRLLKTIKDWEQMQCTYRAKYRSQLERQYLIIKPEAGRDELDLLVRADLRLSQQMFSLGQAEERLREVKERQHEIQQLEQSIRDLHQMFVDVSVMVNQQGEQIGRLQDYVSSTTQYAELASEQMKKSLVQRASLQKKKWIIILVVVVILLVTGIIMFISHLMDGNKTVVVQQQPPPLPGDNPPKPGQKPNPPPPQKPPNTSVVIESGEN